ncbi:hypothetical protein [Turicibacter sanguinis]|uniref:hypothetical protein n=1 Tax=Turicibacter sanguinis TaxID=154288 RepID=UPI0018A8CE2B|nr:hypothetical protein [Turicibacter sanguinis]MDB8559412.1 hypothetical protein [Turicibacter sanguinis]MDB8562160.1 hypothetical protein [Turicibacter sanguinis]
MGNNLLEVVRLQHQDFYVEDLIMISNLKGEYLFKTYDEVQSESPVFKIKRMCQTGNEILIHFVVMGIINPKISVKNEHFYSDIVKSSINGSTIVRETTVEFTTQISSQIQFNKVHLIEQFNGNHNQDEELRIESNAVLSKSNYYYRVTLPPNHGTATVDSKTGKWKYQSKDNSFNDDYFEISVFDSWGSFRVKRLKVTNNNHHHQIQEVKVVNTPLPIMVRKPLPIEGTVKVGNTPTVIIAQPLKVNVLNGITVASLPEVTISNLSSVTIVSLPAVELSGVATVVVNEPLPVSVVNGITVASLPEVTISNLSSVTIVSLPPVELSGVATVVVNEPLPVCVVNGLSLVVTISNFSEVTVANSLTIASLPPVELSGTPTVVIQQPIQITTLQNLPVAMVGRLTTSAVEVANFNTSTMYVTDIYNVADFSDYSFAIYGGAQPATVQVLVAPIAEYSLGIKSITPIALSDITFAGGQLAAIVTGNHYLDFVYLSVLVSLTTTTRITVYFQGYV